MLTIALDFDETLFPTLEKVLEVYNKRHDANIEFDRITSPGVESSSSAYSSHSCPIRVIPL